MNGKPMFIDGLAFWTPQAPGWEAAAPALRGEPLPARESPARPAPPLLAANERRRAPDSVLLALEVASAAMAGSGHDPASTASVFTSAHGDLAITDALCRTLASDPLLLSPTRFHHSVHNAASGYWAIATGCRAPSTALAAFDTSFAAGLLEAASQCLADHAPVLLAGYDTEACGPLTSVNSSRGLLGVALVLASQRSAATRWQLHLRVRRWRFRCSTTPWPTRYPCSKHSHRAGPPRWRCRFPTACSWKCNCSRCSPVMRGEAGVQGDARPMHAQCSLTQAPRQSTHDCSCTARRNLEFA
jgi:hypothetical protein